MASLAVGVLVAVVAGGRPAEATSNSGGGEVLNQRDQTDANEATSTVPTGFIDSTIWSGFSLPTAISFSPDGKVFVGQKNGLIKVFDSTSDASASTVIDLSTKVDNYWDRGFLGLTVDPSFGIAGHNFIYTLYTYDAPPGQTAPVWNDACPTPPGPTTDGCVVTGRLSRIPVDPVSGVAAGGERVLIGPGSNGTALQWCQQFPSHSIGHLAFLPDGSLLVSAGDGASFDNADWGQYGGSSGSPTSPNPCGDPPNGYGVANTSPTGRGGALRAQSPRRPTGEPFSLDGDILRVDPATGAGLPGNPMFSSGDLNARRIVAYGLRNPFRFTVRPGTSEVWIGDVGWGTWEEIDRLQSPTGTMPVNFGWPCYEGAGQQSAYAGLNMCTGLYNDSTNPATAPYYSYNHSAPLGSGDTCRTGSSSISGISFYAGSTYPPNYNGALFFGDHSRSCIWVMFKGANGQPDPSTITTFVDDSDGPNPVDMAEDPASGDIFYANYDAGTIHRISSQAQNHPPTAVAQATSPTSGDPGLTVSFDGTESSDPDGDAITYAWDLDGDGEFDDSTSPTPSHTYNNAGTFNVVLRVMDSHGAFTVSPPITVTIGGGNTPPVPVIDTPSSSLTWAVGSVISFSGHATDAQDGNLTGGSLTWTLVIHHCPSDCHTHIVGTVGTGTSGSFSAPDHEYPSYLELQLTATDSGGLSATTSVNLQPKTVVLTFSTTPGGLQLTVNASTSTATFARTVIVGSSNSVFAPGPQKKGRNFYVWVSWSDGGAQSHNVIAPETATTYTARYRRM